MMGAVVEMALGAAVPAVVDSGTCECIGGHGTRRQVQRGKRKCGDRKERRESESAKGNDCYGTREGNGCAFPRKSSL